MKLYDPDGRCEKNPILDKIQVGLDVAGCIPVLGEVADLTNGTISLCRGNFLDAGLSFASMIPFVGDVIGKGGKVAKGVVENADVVVKNLDEAVGVANKEQKTIVIGESMSRVKQATKNCKKVVLMQKGIKHGEKFPKKWRKNV